MKEAEGIVFNIQYFCVHDGPGIRTTVFLKGCPLRCVWCHNPEGMSRERALAFSESKCAVCGACVEVCPAVHKIEGGKHVMDRTACSFRCNCVEACPAKALEILGKTETVPALVEKLKKDKAYYDESGGGVTVSGGEPTLQPDFLEALLRALKAEGISTAVETCGLCSFDVFRTVLPLTDLFLFDWKETDPLRHREYTSADNTVIRQNLRALHEAGANILLRCPVIPSLNDREDHFKGIADLAKDMPRLLGVEVLPYHDLASSKTGRVGLEQQQSFVQPSAETSAGWRETLRSLGAPVAEA